MRRIIELLEKFWKLIKEKHDVEYSQKQVEVIKHDVEYSQKQIE
jgi:hypothetical protein